VGGSQRGDEVVLRVKRPTNESLQLVGSCLKVGEVVSGN
jgi:hypothetical protein